MSWLRSGAARDSLPTASTIIACCLSRRSRVVPRSALWIVEMLMRFKLPLIVAGRIYGLGRWLRENSGSGSSLPPATDASSNLARSTRTILTDWP